MEQVSRLLHLCFLFILMNFRWKLQKTYEKFAHFRKNYYLCTRKIIEGHRSLSDVPNFTGTKRFAILHPQ